MTTASVSAARRPPPPGHPFTVVFGRPRFSADHRWSDLHAAWTGDLRSLADRVVIEHTGHNQLGTRLRRGHPPVHVVVPTTSPVTAEMIEHGSFGLIQQFGAGTDAIDLDAAARCGVRVANMPGLNAVPVAEPGHACLSTTATPNQAGVVTGMPTAPATRRQWAC